MHGNSIIVLESNVELLPIIEDVDSDVKVSRRDVILFEERIEVIGWLYKHMLKAESELR